MSCFSQQTWVTFDTEGSEMFGSRLGDSNAMSGWAVLCSEKPANNPVCSVIRSTLFLRLVPTLPFGGGEWEKPLKLKLQNTKGLKPYTVNIVWGVGYGALSHINPCTQPYIMPASTLEGYPKVTEPRWFSADQSFKPS